VGEGAADPAPDAGAGGGGLVAVAGLRGGRGGGVVDVAGAAAADVDDGGGVVRLGTAQLFVEALQGAVAAERSRAEGVAGAAAAAVVDARGGVGAGRGLGGGVSGHAEGVAGAATACVGVAGGGDVRVGLNDGEGRHCELLLLCGVVCVCVV